MSQSNKFIIVLLLACSLALPVYGKGKVRSRSGLNQGSADARYLKLDCSNDPLTGSLDITAAGVPLDIQNTTDASGNVVQVLKGGNRATPADGDSAYLCYYADDDTGTQVEFARFIWTALDVTNDTKDSAVRFDVMHNNSLIEMLELTTNSIILNEDNNDINYRFESANDANLFWIDGGLDTVTIGSATSLGKFGIDGTEDEIQLLVQGHSTQTSSLIVAENSAGVDQMTLSNVGVLNVVGSITEGGNAIYNSTELEGTVVLSTGENGASKFLREDGDGTCSWQAAAGGGTMSSFILEDADGTEVSISDAEEVKFIETTGIDINWTDTDPGSDADPFDLTFTIDTTAIAGAIGAGEYADDTVNNDDVNWGDIDFLDDEGAIDIEAYTARTAFESGDKMVIFEAGVGPREIDYDDLPAGAGDPDQNIFETITGITNDVVADTTTDSLTLTGAGIVTVVGTTATDTITFTGTEAQDLSAVCTIGATYAGAITVDGVVLSDSETIGWGGDESITYDGTDFQITDNLDFGTNILTDAMVAYILNWSASVGTIHADNYIENVVDTLASTLGAAADANNVDITSMAKLEGVDVNTYIDMDTTDIITTKGNLIPSANGADDLGTDALEYNNAWFDGTMEADTITEGGNAVYNSTDDLWIKLGGDVASAGNYDFGGADLELPQAAPGAPDADGEIEMDFTDGSLVIQHGSAHAELGAATDVVVGKLIKSWSATYAFPDLLQAEQDNWIFKQIDATEFPHGVVIVEILLSTPAASSYALNVENWDDPDTINAGNPTIDAIATSASQEAVETAITYGTIAAGQIIKLDLDTDDVAEIHVEIFYYEPIA